MVRVNVTSAGQNTSVAITPPQSYYDGLSKQWAVSEDMVNGEEYSSKHYAQESKKQADIATEQAQTTTTKVEEINSATSTALNDIENKRSSAIAEVETKQNQAVSAVETAQSTAESSIQDQLTIVENTITTGVANVNSAKSTAISDINTAGQTQITNIQQEGATQVSNIKQTGFYMQDGKLYYTDSEGNSKKFTQGGSLPLASIYLAPFGIDESENLGRYLNGQVIIQSQFTEFTKEVKSWQTTRPDLFTTETNWQAEKTASILGQCGKFVVDDTAGTIRLPLVININGLTDLANCGVIKDESLPNINGWLYATNSSGSWGLVSDSGATNFNKIGGAFQANNVGQYSQSVATGKAESSGKVSFSASRSSSTYQDNAPVQQEAIQYPYVIVVNTGVEEAERPINNYQVNNVYSYGMSQYYKGTMNNNSWLRSAGQWNSGTVYNGVYEWAVAQQVAGVDGFKLSTEEYTDYDWVINTEEQTFRLPLLDGSETLLGNAKQTFTLTNKAFHSPSVNGYYLVRKTISASNQYIYMGIYTQDGTLLTANTYMYSNSSGTGVITSPLVRKGQKLYVQTTFGGDDVEATFVPAVGNGNLYYYIGDTLQNADLINIARMQEDMVNKTDKTQAAHAAMPSDKRVNLTLGASGTTYTAPTEGWFVMTLEPSTSGIVSLDNTTCRIYNQMYVSAQRAVQLYTPAKKSDSIAIEYSNKSSSTLNSIFFVYAEGAK